MALLAMVALAATGCGPSPDAVCDKMFSLAEAELGAAAVKAAVGEKSECVKNEARRKEMQGFIKYKDNNECLMNASSWTAVKACGEKK